MGVDYSVVEEPDELVASEEMDADDGYASLDEQEQRSRRVSGVHDRSPSVLASGGRGKKKQRAGVRVYLRVTQLISRRWAHHPCYLQPPRGDVCTVGRVTASSSTAAGSSSTASDHDVREPEPVAAAPTLERIQRGRHVIKIEPLDCAPPYEWRQRVITERFERLRVEFKLRVLKRDTRDTTTFGKRLDAAYESRAANNLSETSAITAKARIEELEKLLAKARGELEMERGKTQLGERPTSEEPSSDEMRKAITSSTGRSKYSSRAWLAREKVDELMLHDWKALHGGVEGFAWRLLLLLRTLGYAFWMKLLLTPWFKKFVHTTIQREALNDQHSMDNLVKSLVARSRITGTSLAAWQKIHMAIDTPRGGDVVSTCLGPIKTMRRLMSSYMDTRAMAHLASQDWFPRAFAGPEIADKWGAALGDTDLVEAVRTTKCMMRDLAQYLTCLVKLLMEEPHLRKRLIWFAPEGTAKFLHWELGFEGDGFPPGCFELLLHPFNLGRLCNHDDFNLTLLAGELDEKGTVAMALSKLLDNQFDEIREKGLKIELDLPAGTFPGCTGKAVYQNTFGDTGKGDLVYLALAFGNGTCSSNRPEHSRKLNLSESAKYDATPDDYPRIPVADHVQWSRVPEAERKKAELAAAQVHIADETDDVKRARVAAAGQRAAADAADAAGHNQVHGSPLKLIATNAQYDGLHSTENATTKFTQGVITATIDADERDMERGKQARTKSFGRHVGNFIAAMTRIPNCKKVSQKVANKWSPDKRVRQEETSWRFNGAAARSVLDNIWEMDDVMEVSADRVIRHRP